MCRSGVGVCSYSHGLTAARYGFVAAKKPRAALGALRVVVVGGASGRWRGAAGKAHALWPLVAVIVSVCHSNHLASCVTCLSYIKDARHMGMCAKSLTNGMNVAAPRAKRHGNRSSKADKMKASKTNDVSRRSSQKRRRSFCSSAFGRATSGAAVPRPYPKATK